MILGNPLKREVYGYLHLRKEKGILLLRNPGVAKRKVSITLTPDLGDINPSTEYYLKVIYPYNLILPKPVKMNQKLSIELDGYEVLSAELIPADKIDKKLPVGIKYSLDNGNIIVYGTPGKKETIESVGKKKLGEVHFGNKKTDIKYERESLVKNDGLEFVSHVKVNVPGFYKNAKFGFLLESNKKLQKDLKPGFEIKVNGVTKELRIEEEHGKWFWVMADLTPGKNNIVYRIKFKEKEKGKISSWIISDKELVGKKIENVSVSDNEILPAKPYPANIQKEIIPIMSSNIQ